MKTQTITLQLPKQEPSPIPPVLASTFQAAEALGIARSTVYQLIDAGELQTVKIGKRRMVPVCELHAFVARSMKKEA